MANEEVIAEKIMIPLDSYPHVPYWFTLRQAIAEMEKTQIDTGDKKSLPRVVLVFDEEYRLIGMVRRRDILRGLGPDALQEPIERAGERDPGVSRDLLKPPSTFHADLAELRKRADRPVQEIMIPIRISVNHDSSLMEVIQAMVVNDVSLVVVLKEGVASGVARSVDVLRAVGDLVL